MKAIDLLTKLKACPEAIVWAGDKSIQEAWNTCHRGDWMLWFYQTRYPENLRQLTLAKVKCAETVAHLMPPASLEAIEVAIAFAYGSASREELDKAARAAHAGFVAVYTASDITYTHLETANICRKYLNIGEHQ